MISWDENLKGILYFLVPSQSYLTFITGRLLPRYDQEIRIHLAAVPVNHNNQYGMIPLRV